MTTTTNPQPHDARDLVDEAERYFKQKDWEQLAALEARLPPELDGPALELADGVAFGLGRLGRADRAAALYERAWQAAPSYRRASGLAYVHYAAAMEIATGRTRKPTGKGRRGTHNRDTEDAGSRRARLEAHRKGFRRWIEQALRLHPSSIKDLYRLGIFEAQVENQHDAVALRAFLRALDVYRAMSPDERQRAHQLRKYVSRTLYAAGRSAQRLRRVPLARRLSFDCIRSDGDGAYVARVHQLGLAGRVCLAGRELEHAERAFRLALDADGPPRRDYLYGYLAEVEQARGDLAAGCRWIEANTRPERRAASLWRKLGELRLAAGELEAAVVALEAALRADRGGKHLTLTLLGQAHEGRGELKRAERAYRDADAFRRRRYLSPHLPALHGLAGVLERRGRAEEAGRVRGELAELEAGGPGLAHGRRPPAREAEVA